MGTALPLEARLSVQLLVQNLILTWQVYLLLPGLKTLMGTQGKPVPPCSLYTPPSWGHGEDAVSGVFSGVASPLPPAPSSYQPCFTDVRFQVLCSLHIQTLPGSHSPSPLPRLTAALPQPSAFSSPSSSCPMALNILHISQWLLKLKSPLYPKPQFSFLS